MLFNIGYQFYEALTIRYIIFSLSYELYVFLIKLIYMYSFLGNGLVDLLNSTKNKELNRRLFIQECRYNLSLLNLTDWKGSSRDFKKYIINNLKTEITTLMLCHHKNDIFQIAENKVNKIFLKDDRGDEPNSSNLFTQIINKISLLKVIVNIPENLSKYDKSDLDIRIKNLTKSLTTVIKIIDS